MRRHLSFFPVIMYKWALVVDIWVNPIINTSVSGVDARITYILLICLWGNNLHVSAFWWLHINSVTKRHLVYIILNVLIRNGNKKIIFLSFSLFNFQSYTRYKTNLFLKSLDGSNICHCFILEFGTNRFIARSWLNLRALPKSLIGFSLYTLFTRYTIYIIHTVFSTDFKSFVENSL